MGDRRLEIYLRLAAGARDVYLPYISLISPVSLVYLRLAAGARDVASLAERGGLG